MAVNTDADVIDVQSEGELDVVVESEELVASSRRPAPIEHKSSLIPHGKDELEMKVEREVKSKKKVRRGNRGKQGKQRLDSSSSMDTSIDLNMSTDSLKLNKSVDKSVDSVKSTGSKRRAPTKPLVEFSVYSVLKHPAHLKHHMLQRTGKVVAIREMKHSRKAAGSIKLMTDPNSNFFFFSPTDSKVPRMKIPLSEAPGGFTVRPQDCEGIMFVARIVRWEQVNAALGTLEGSLGKNSDIKVRTEGLLIENNIDSSDFGPEVLQDLPSNHQSWTIPPAELKRRRDFRKECVFTIDPLTARDLDDALSVTKEANGLFRVGVHIADVSYFVREETALDRVASERTTSTYLVDQV